MFSDYRGKDVAVSTRDGRGYSSISPRVTATIGTVVSPNQLDSALDGRNRFTNMAVLRFDVTVC